MNQFIESINGLTYKQVINQLGDRSKTSANSQPGGPINRYVINPHDGNVIDMRHMLIVGPQYGEFGGKMIEFGQWVLGQASGMNAQDFYSNRLGANFRTTYLMKDALYPNNFSNYLNNFFSTPTKYNHKWKGSIWF